VIRYPVDLHSSAKTDDRITRELLGAIEREPKRHIVSSAEQLSRWLVADEAGQGISSHQLSLNAPGSSCAGADAQTNSVRLSWSLV